MNKARRKQLDDVVEKINAACAELESIMNDEEEYRDNMPENLQGSEKFEAAESACDAMQTAIDSLEEAVTSVETAQE